MKNLLLITVFVTGIASLIIEVVGVRLLSPYFGNTLFTVSSVISVFLAALSLGYYLGGRLSEKKNDFAFFYGIIAGGGMLVLLTLVISKWFLSLYGMKLPMTTGPIVSSVIAFFAPGVILGIVSPMAVRLGQTVAPEEGVGRIAGEIFFWSTAGSIIGSLSTGFFLIPFFGITNIIFFTGVGLVLLGVIPMAVINKRKKKWYFLTFSLLTIPFLTWKMAESIPAKGIVWQKDGVYEMLTVQDAEYLGRPTRFFFQDRSWSGAKYLDDGSLVFTYTKYYNLYKAFRPDVKEALVIGGGIYSIPVALRSDNPESEIVVSEIEPILPNLAKNYFGFEDDQGITTLIEDGRRVMSGAERKFDYIFSDVYYSYFSIPSHFTTAEFYRTAKDHMNPDGVFLANIVGSLSKTQPSLAAAQIRTFRSVFPNSYFVACDSPFSTGIQGIIFVGVNGDQKPEWENVPGMDQSALINPERLNLEAVPIFTDDYAPTDYYSSKLFLIPKEYDPAGEMLGTINDLTLIGPRYLSSPQKSNALKYIKANLLQYTDNVEEQKWMHTNPDGSSVEMENIIGRFDPNNPRRIILATHFDSKRYANLDRKHRDSSVPGANDSGSGTALLLETARYLYGKQDRKSGIDLIFFDGEEGEENLTDSNWSALGSKYFSENLIDYYPKVKPQRVIVFDMVCDNDLHIPVESSSATYDPEGVKGFWEAGRKLYPEVFSGVSDLTIRDDHTYLYKAGIPSFLVIDFDYKYFHTSEDTPDKCSTQSLRAVYNTLIDYLSSNGE